MRKGRCNRAGHDTGAGAGKADAARALLKYLASPDAARVMKANGLEPPG